MTAPEEGYYGSIKLPSTDGESPVKSSSQSARKVLTLGASGIVIGVGGYSAVMSLSRTGEPWMPGLIALFLCAISSLTLGIIAIVKSGKITQKKVLARVIGIVSIVIGGLILGISALLMVVLSLMSSSSPF